MLHFQTDEKMSTQGLSHDIHEKLLYFIEKYFIIEKYYRSVLEKGNLKNSLL